MNRQSITTPNAPAAIGPYSQAVRAGDTVYVSGQIPLDPATGEVTGADFEARLRRVLDNLVAVLQAAGARRDQVAKLTVYLTDLGEFPTVNAVMAEYFTEPYPARAAVQVAALPKGVDVELDAVAVLA
jgi:reactive intermediate/imine deaminase